MISCFTGFSYATNTPHKGVSGDNKKGTDNFLSIP